MRKGITFILENQLIKGSAIVVIGGFLASLVSFLFTIIMTRNLSPADVGILYSLISLYTLFTMPASAITPTIVQFGATYFAKQDYARLRGLFFEITKFMFVIGFVIFCSFLFFSSIIGDFFKISERSLIWITGATIFVAYLSVITGSLLQAKLAFKFTVFMSIISAFVKLLLGGVLVLLGFKVAGAMWGYFISFIASYLISFYPLKFLKDKSLITPHISFKELFSYGAPAAFTFLGLTGFITLDILLVKHFFTPEMAGLYIAMTVPGKIIYFLTAPINTVMFPLVVQRREKNENFHTVFFLALAIVLLPSLCVTFFYFIFPQFAIAFTIKQDIFQTAAPYLGYYGIFITIYSLLSLFVNFFLAIKKTKILFPVLTAALLQVIGIWIYHKDFTQVLTVSISVGGLLLLSFLLYYLKLYGKKKTR